MTHKQASENLSVGDSESVDVSPRKAFSEA